MPEPGITDPDFNRPTTKPARGPFSGRGGKKRLPARKKLPLEFVAFRLNDGRALGDVVAPDIFGPPSGSDGGAVLPRGVRDRLAENKSPLAGIMRDDPRIAPRPEPSGGIFDGGGARVPALSADPGLGTPPRGGNMASHASLSFEPEAEDADGAGLAKPGALGVGPRAFARKKLPGVGAPVSLQEAYDRVDAEEERLAQMGRDMDADGLMALLGLDPVYRPDGSRPVDHFGARVEEYINGSRSERAGFRDKISLDGAVSELIVTQRNFQNYLDSLDKRADIHDDSLDGDVLAGQAAVNARKRDIRAVTERELQKLIPDVGKPTNETVDAALMYEKLGFDSDESRLSGYASLAGRPIDSWQANNILEESAEIATRLAREGHFTLYSEEWDVFRHGYASVRITMEYGPWAAKRLGDVNETTRRDNLTDEALADLYNNNVGRKLAIEALTSAGPLSEVVLESVRRGDYPALGGGRRDWPLEEIVLKAIRDGKFQMQPFQLKQSAAPH